MTFAAETQASLAPSPKRLWSGSSLPTQLPDTDGQVLFAVDATLCQDVGEQGVEEAVNGVSLRSIEAFIAHAADKLAYLPLDFPNFLISLRCSGSRSLFTALLGVLGVMVPAHALLALCGQFAALTIWLDKATLTHLLPTFLLGGWGDGLGTERSTTKSRCRSPEERRPPPLRMIAYGLACRSKSLAPSRTLAPYK